MFRVRACIIFQKLTVVHAGITAESRRDYTLNGTGRTGQKVDPNCIYMQSLTQFRSFFGILIVLDVKCLSLLFFRLNWFYYKAFMNNNNQLYFR